MKYNDEKFIACCAPMRDWILGGHIVTDFKDKTEMATAAAFRYNKINFCPACGNKITWEELKEK